MATTSNGVGGNGYKLGSIVVTSSCIYSATNSKKTHPIMMKFGKYPYLHAEIAACIKAGVDNLQGSTVYVARVLKNNEQALAKPCSTCMKFMEYYKVRRVIWTNNNGGYSEHYFN